MTIVTLYALLGDDLRLIYAPKDYDEVFTNLTIVSLILFTIELTLSAAAVENYLNSFFFWLDLVSTFSLITDIGPIMDWLSGSDSSQSDDITGSTIATTGTAQTDTVSLARASRGAKLGSKAGRLTRVIRIIRLVRIVKLYKSANQALAKQEAKISSAQHQLEQQLKINKGTSVLSQQAISEAMKDQMPESRVGRQLSEKTTR